MEGKNKTKTCTLCEQELPVERFYTYKKTGLPWAYCRTCHYERYTKERKKKWDQDNPDRARDINSRAAKNWQRKNKDRVKANQQKWYKKNREKILQAERDKRASRNQEK